MRLFLISSFAIACLLAGCTGATSNQHAPLTEHRNIIRNGDQLYIVIEGYMRPPGELFRVERTVDKDGFITLPWINKVRLGGVDLKDAPHAVHRAFRAARADGEGMIWVWRLESAAQANDPNSPLEVGDYLKIVMSGLSHPQEDEFLAMIAADGTLQISGLDKIPAAHRSERQIEAAIAAALHKKGLQSPDVIIWKLTPVDQ